MAFSYRDWWRAHPEWPPSEDLAGIRVRLRECIRRRDGNEYPAGTEFLILCYGRNGLVDLKLRGTGLGQGILLGVHLDQVEMSRYREPGASASPAAKAPARASRRIAPWLFWRMREGRLWHCYRQREVAIRGKRTYIALCGSHTRLGIGQRRRERPKGSKQPCVKCLREEDRIRQEAGFPPVNAELIAAALQKWKRKEEVSHGPRAAS